MSHDYASQRRETYDTFRQSKGVKLPREAVVDFAFYPEIQNANWGGLEKALKSMGYRTSRLVEDDEYLIASVGPIAITADEIWYWEEKATRAAVSFEFYPDGWDFDL